MKKIVALILTLQLFILPGAVFAQTTGASTSQPAKSLSSNLNVKSGPIKSLKNTTDYLDPANYPLIPNGGYIASLMDSYGTYQNLSFADVTTSTTYGSDYMSISLSYSSQMAYTKDCYLNVEFFTESNNLLNYEGYAQYNTYGYNSVYLNTNVPKLSFSDQPYIYMRVGVLPSSYSAYYSDVTTFKVANPFYSAGNSATNDTYAVISNESTNSSSAESTGTLNLDKMNVSINKNLKQSAYHIDYNKPFDPSSVNGKLVQRSASISPSYNVGDTKYFWVSNLTNNSNYQLPARLAYSGTKANVWVNNNQISDADAAMLGQEFDNKIYSTVTSNFGPESDVNHDGKINILCYDIQDGFSGSGGYVAGYFWAGDLYNTSYSNQSEIFYIDTYPTMGISTTKNVANAYSTLAHEFQHMVDYNQNVLIEGSHQMDTWLDEGLSMASEQIYEGHGLSDRVDYYNASTSIKNGHSLLNWDYSGDVLSNYSLSYLFVQYLKIQAGQGDRIFKEILDDPNNDYKAVEDVAKKYISPDMTFGKLMTDFRTALLLKQPTGLYGFKGDPFFNSVQDQLYSGGATNLYGGGAVVAALNSQTGLTIPPDKGQDVTYNFFKMNSSTASPSSPNVDPIGDTDTQITGTAEPTSTVIAKVGQNEIGRATSDDVGAFVINIPKQAAGTVIQVYEEDAAGNLSDPTSITVNDNTPPAKPTVNQVTDQDHSVSGQAEAGSIIQVNVGNNVIGSATAGSDGTFSVSIPVQKAGTSLEITAADTSGNVSDPAYITVKDITAPNQPVVNPVSDKDILITGQAEASSKITVNVNGTVIGSGTTGSNGTFSVSIPIQKAGTSLAVTSADSAGNVSNPAYVTVKDITAPGKPVVYSVTDKDTLVTGLAEAGSKITVKVNGTVIGSATTGTDGTFSVSIPVQKAGTSLAVTSADSAGNVSDAAYVTVKDTTAPGKPVVNTVSDKDTLVTGLAEASSKITVKVNSNVIGSATTGSDGKFSVSIPVQKAGTVLQITSADSSGNNSPAVTITVIDKTAPAAPTIYPVSDHSNAVTGKAEAGATITVTIGTKQYVAKADGNGNFKISIPYQKAGTNITVTAKDAAGNVSPMATVSVSDKTAPAAPTVYPVSDHSNSVTGKAEAGAKITVTIGAQSYTANAYASGNFKVTIPFQKAGTKLSVTATDAAANVSPVVTVTVADKTPPAAPVVNPVSDRVNAVTGKAEAGSTVWVAIGTKKYSAKADASGNFKVMIPPQKAGTKLTITATDSAGNVSPAVTITVIDKTAPAAPVVNPVSDLSKAVTGKAEAGSTVTVTIGSNKYFAKSDTKGNFTVTIPLQKAGTSLTVTVADSAGNISPSKTITVIDKTPPAAPKVNTVKSSATTVTGNSEAYATITIKAGNTVIGTATADKNGNFSVKIKAQKKNTMLTITASDKAKNISKPMTIKVQ